MRPIAKPYSGGRLVMLGRHSSREGRLSVPLTQAIDRSQDGGTADEPPFPAPFLWKVKKHHTEQDYDDSWTGNSRHR